MAEKKNKQTQQSKLQSCTSLLHTSIYTHSHTDIQNVLAPTADNSVTKPVTISRRSLFTYIKMEVLLGLITYYLHYIYKHTHTHLLFENFKP